MDAGKIRLRRMRKKGKGARAPGNCLFTTRGPGPIKLVARGRVTRKFRGARERRARDGEKVFVALLKFGKSGEREFWGKPSRAVWSFT